MLQLVLAIASILPFLQLPVLALLAFLLFLGARFFRRPALLAAAVGFFLNAFQLILENISGWMPGHRELSIFQGPLWFIAIVLGLDLLASFCYFEAAIHGKHSVEKEGFNWYRDTLALAFRVDHVIVASVSVLLFALILGDRGYISSGHTYARVLSLSPNVFFASLSLLLLARSIRNMSLKPEAAALRWGSWAITAYALIQPLYFLRAILPPNIDLPSLTQTQNLLLQGFALGYLLGFLCKLSFLVSFAACLLSRMSASIREADEFRRLESMTELILGVAHTFRQPLGLMNPAIRQLERHAKTTEALVQIESLRSSVGRMDSLIERFLLLREIHEGRRVSTSLRQLARDAQNRAQTRYGGIQRATLEVVNYAPKWLGVSVIPELIESAIDAVVDNAYEAMEEQKGLDVVITTRMFQGGIATIEIWNSGPAITPNSKEKIFDIYYTTKDQGSGLGLYFTREYMRLLGFDIYCADVEKGCKFVLRLRDAFDLRELDKRG